jgi:methionyl-tRNA formyltransferase
MRIAFAGDRDISVQVLEVILNCDIKPLALLLPELSKASHSRELIRMCPFLKKVYILIGSIFRQPHGIEVLQKLDLDYIVCIHFPYIVPESVLNLPKFGTLNLHPAFLPFNRGWHTPVWAILEDTPIGATLHFMDSDIDTGDIVHQKRLVVTPSDTADILYKKLKRLELDVFKESWPRIVSGNFMRNPQNIIEGTVHKRSELFSPAIQRIDLDEPMKAAKLINRLRALTTNDIREAAYYEIDGKRYRILVSIQEEN